MNFVERILTRKLSPKTRERMQIMVAAALGFFLGMRYNTYLTDVLNRYLPLDSGNLLIRGAILFGVTVVIVYATVFLSKLLDGK